MPSTTLAPGQWSTERANAWRDARPWICGFNYIPSNAVNFLEMWQAGGFDPETIARELGWAGSIRLNALRTNPQFLAWRHDRNGLFERIDRLLEIAAANGISTILCPFDDCGFSGEEPFWGPQPDPIPKVHNSRALASPGRKALMDESRWPEYEAYLKDLVRRYSHDERVLFWDLYNEPTNRAMFLPDGYAEGDKMSIPQSHRLMKDCFTWAREIGPAQPLTVAPWITPQPGESGLPYQTGCEQDAMALSDIVTFHAYAPTERVAQFLDYLEGFGRPLIATEWMARGVDSRIGDQLPMFKARNVGAIKWGLVEGRSQTWLPWPPELSGAGYDLWLKDGLWFHDLFYTDGRPYDVAEIGTIRELTGRETGTP